MESRLMKKVFDPKRWVELIDKAEKKGINKTVLRKMCEPSTRIFLYNKIKVGEYEISPPHIVLIPKDNGDFRECKANEDIDRIFLTLINDCLMELFPNMIHKSCKSYQKGIGCQEIVKQAVRQIENVSQKRNSNFIGYKLDLSKYFDSVKIEWIDRVFDEVEWRLGFKKGTEPIINMLRKYYHSDWLFSAEGNLTKQYTSLKQGCAVAAFLADVILYNMDRKMENYCSFYVRYSDDMLLISENPDFALSLVETELNKYGLKVNPQKVEALYKDKFFTFLGFKIKGELITLSKNRVKKFQKTVEGCTIKRKNITAEQARKNVMRRLYSGDYNWATSCFGIINCKPDIQELNKFILDCIRACKTENKKIGGLGSVDNLPDRTILRGKGKNVRANRDKTEGYIKEYISVGCLVENYQRSAHLFEAVVRGIL